MSDDLKPAAVERLFPFVLRSRILLVGRDTLRRSRSRLQFVLMTTDLSEGSGAQMLKDFECYPVVQCYTAADLERHFGVRGTKVIGFVKSRLAQSIYAELKTHRINCALKPQENAKSAGTHPKRRYPRRQNPIHHKG
jgi:hypothetical protein